MGVLNFVFGTGGTTVGRSWSHRERATGSRPKAADLREWVEDFVAVTRSHRIEECFAALTEAGFTLPPSDGWERFQAIWDYAQREILDNWKYGQKQTAPEDATDRGGGGSDE